MKTTIDQMKPPITEASSFRGIPKKANDFVETYSAPPPPKNGRIIGVDCHPDIFTVSVFIGQTAYDAHKLEGKQNLSLEALLAWAEKNFTREDIFLTEAGGNSFAVCEALQKRGLRACVLESAHIAKNAKVYADDDRMASERIALVYLGGPAPAVWMPDPQTRQRRELLRTYRRAVDDHTAATNALKSYLNGHTIRLGSRDLKSEKTRAWIEQQRNWSKLDKKVLEGYFMALDQSEERRTFTRKVIAEEMAQEPLMLRCMKLLGIGMINAFAILAVVGDVRRFERPQKLVAYLGLNPGQRRSGESKKVKVGIGKRGRGDLRHLLIQGAQAVFRMGKATALGEWGWKLFARTGNRNVAVAAVARKLVVQVWHVLHGNPPTALEKDKSFTEKLRKLVTVLGKEGREALGLGLAAADCIQKLIARVQEPKPIDSCA